MHESHCNENVSISIWPRLQQGILTQEKLNASKSNNYPGKESSGLTNGIKSENLVSAGVSVETNAATRIQTAFRAYKVC